jgi:hypothetical protein
MFCPKCMARLPQPSVCCGHCHFSLAEVEGILGAQDAIIEPVMDVAHCLGVADRASLLAKVDEFERRFPQVHLALFAGLLPPVLNVATAGFWLLNHGVRTKHGRRMDNELGVVILIDPQAHQVGFSVGYGLEQMLAPEKLSALLEKARQRLQHRDYASAFRSLIRGIDQLLRSAANGRVRGAPAIPAQVKPNHVPLGLPEHETAPLKPREKAKGALW